MAFGSPYIREQDGHRYYVSDVEPMLRIPESMLGPISLDVEPDDRPLRRVRFVEAPDDDD